MRLSAVILAGAAAAICASPAAAQTVGIGSTKSSMVAAMTTAISNVVSTKTILKMRREEMGGTQKYIPVVNAGELEFGVSNIVQYTMAKEGRDLSKKPYENLQLVATMMRFRAGILVRNDSDIRSVTDLKGKRLAYGFKGAPLFDIYFRGFLGTGGISYDNDVEHVPAVGLVQHWNLFKQGKIDGAMAGLAGGPNKDMNATIPSGVRYINLIDGPNSAAALARLKGGELELIKPAKAYVAIKEPAVLFAYDFMLFTSKKVPDEVVYHVAKAMSESVKDLHAAGPVWRSFSAERMPRDQQGLEYHAGAMKLYQEKGLWKR